MDWDLNLIHFETERLPWLKEALRRLEEDPTQSFAIFGPKKCGKTQLVKTLSWRASLRACQLEVSRKRISHPHPLKEQP